LIEADSPN